MNKKIFMIVLSVLLMLPCMVIAQLGDVRIYTHVGPEGQTLDRITIETDAKTSDLPKASDFTMEADHRYNRKTWRVHPNDISLEDGLLSLTFESFPVSFLDVGWWDMRCRKRAFAFNKSNVVETFTEVADDFVRYSIYREDWSPTGEAFDYSLYTPAEADEPLPLVLVLHGMSDYEIVLSGREAVAWAEPQNQQKHPCYVLVPYFDDATTISREEVLSATMDKIRSMVSDGLVDPARIYVTGLSMGGYHATILITRYSEEPVFAAAMMLAPWLDRTLTDEEIARAKEIPIQVIYGERDPYIPNPGELCDRLEAMGATNYIKTVLTAEDFASRGIESQHSVDLIVYEDDSYVDWMFEQSLEK